MDVASGYKYREQITGESHWYMLQSRNFITNSSFQFENGNAKKVSFNGQSVTFRLSIERV